MDTSEFTFKFNSLIMESMGTLISSAIPLPINIQSLTPFNYSFDVVGFMIAAVIAGAFWYYQKFIN